MSLPYRRSVRFSKSHYNRGFYFVTICTRDRIHRFGDIVDGVIHLYELGEFVTQVLQTIREHNRYAECTLFVVMPNHIHAIFAIDLKNVPTAHFVGGVLQKSADNFHFRRGCCGNEAFAEILRLNKVKQQICETKLP